MSAAATRQHTIESVAMGMAAALGIGFGQASAAIHAARTPTAAEFRAMRIRLEWAMRDPSVVRYRQTSRGRVPVLDPVTRAMQRIIRKRGWR